MSDYEKKILTPNQSIHQRLSDFLPLFSLIILIIIFGMGHSAFLSLPNLYNVLRQSSVLLVASLGGTFIILMGSIDLSVASIIALCGIVTPTLLDLGLGIPLSIVGGILTGCLAGLLNGFIFAYGKIPSFLVTLGTMSAIEGLSLKITNGRTLSIFDQSFRWMSSGSFIGALPEYSHLGLVGLGDLHFADHKDPFWEIYVRHRRRGKGCAAFGGRNQ